MSAGTAGLLTVGVAAMVAATAQTISGFGMNLILAPVAQLVVPGAAAVRLVTGAGSILNAGLLATGWRSIRWRAALYLAVPGLAATALLGPVIAGAGQRLVSVLVAAVTLLAITASAAAVRPSRLTGRAGAIIAGLLSGVLNVSSGVNGPPVAVYAAAQPWATGELVATVQAVFLPTNVAAFIVLRAVPLAPAVLGAGVAGTLAGLVAGAFLRDRVPADVVRVGVLAVAAAGAVIILVRAFT